MRNSLNEQGVYTLSFCKDYFNFLINKKIQLFKRYIYEQTDEKISQRAQE